MYLDFSRRIVRILTAVVALSALASPRAGLAQPEAPESASPKFRVVGASERLEMIVNTSRILEMDFKVPRMLVNNTDIVQATPLSPQEVQISALRPGVTNLNLWDEQNRIHTVDILVIGDARELKALLESEFPEASLKVTPLSNSVVISGFVPSADMVSRIISIAEDYYPNVINNLSVGGAQTVLLKVKVLEVSRTKLRRLGFDWAFFNEDVGIVQNVTGLLADYALVPGAGTVTGGLGETLAFGVVDGNSAFFGFLEALRQYNLVKTLAEPNLVTVSGRPARFNSGGEFPILIPQSFGTISIEYREFGTQVDFVPIVLGNGNLRLEVRPEVSEIDPARSVNLGNVNVPGLRTRWVDTAVEMRAGQTLALAGLIQSRTEALNRGLPLLADLPWVGAAFRKVEETQNEIELLILVTPEFVDAVDCQEFPPCGPGMFTHSPDDCELYGKGYLEVPNGYSSGAVHAGATLPVAVEHRVVAPAAGPTPAAGGLNLPPSPPGVPASSASHDQSSALRESISNRRTATTRPSRSPRAEGDEAPALIGPIGYETIK